MHFAEEERFMVARGCPHLEPHRAAHARLMGQLRALEGEAGQATAEAALAGVHRLRAWLLDHVEGPDRALAEWTAAADLEAPDEAPPSRAARDR